ncbi:MAG: hypothetical protein GQ574_07475 [Crocinitomix sp.]|nr:hypothetical protein [Crocinitomix sp.]
MTNQKILRTLILVCVILLKQVSSFSQDNNSKDQTYFSFELAGVGGLASLNFEHNVLDKEVLDIQMRYGLSYMPIDKNNGGGIIIPVLAHFLIGKGAHKLDLGAGQALTITTKGSLFILAPLSFGYRYQPTDKNYFLRAAYTPIVSYLLDFQWQNWAGLTYGYHFNRKK